MSIHDMAWTAGTFIAGVAAIALIVIVGTALERWLLREPSIRWHDAGVNPNQAPVGSPPVVQTRPSQPPTQQQPPAPSPTPPMLAREITLCGGPLDGQSLGMYMNITMVRLPCESAAARGFLYADYRRDSQGRFVFDGYAGPRFDPGALVEERKP